MEYASVVVVSLYHVRVYVRGGGWCPKSLCSKHLHRCTCVHHPIKGLGKIGHLGRLVPKPVQYYPTCVFIPVTAVLHELLKGCTVPI